MENSKEVQVLKEISGEIDNSHLSITYATNCIKAQTYLINKLNNKAQRLKERCSVMCSANMMLESEISHAQQEIKSVIISQGTINNNIELKKELLSTKEQMVEINERIENGEKKYEAMWMESKARYESVPYVQRLLKANKEVKDIEEKILKLEEQEKNILEKEILSKKQFCKTVDCKRICELAEFSIVHRPKLIEMIKERINTIQKLKNEFKNMEIQEEELTALNEKNDNTKEKNQNDMILPRLQLDYWDLNSMNLNTESVNYEDMTTSADRSYSVHSVIVIDPLKINKNNKMPRVTNYTSSAFYKPLMISSATNDENETANYSRKKLINILEDIKIDRNEAQRMIADVNVMELETVETISADDYQKSKNTNDVEISNEIDDINLTRSQTDTIVRPPSQFLDMCLEQQKPENEFGNKSIQDNLGTHAPKVCHEPSKKQVKFDFSNLVETNVAENNTKLADTDAINSGTTDPYETVNSQQDTTEQEFAKMKELIMKKHNFDVSPEVVYTKNSVAPKNIENLEENVVTSKFFQHQDVQDNSDKSVTENDANQITADKQEYAPNKIGTNNAEKVKHTIETEVVSCPKRTKVGEMMAPEKEPSVFMYGQSDEVSGCFEEESMNTTTYYDEGELPQLDCSLLASPKPYMPIQNLESQEVRSQDVPNFLSGLRKTGFSFFGRLESSDPKPDSSAQKTDNSGFNFNFGDGKKTRGSLFSMFQ